MAHDLLTEPLLSWRDVRGVRHHTTLPGILASLASGDLRDFPRVRPHQLHPWCMFLTQLAAIALRKGGQANPRLSETAWRSQLLGLTDERHEPWSLVVDDLASPAFLQPPVPERTLTHWRSSEHPDDAAIDVLITAKNHDVKGSAIDGADREAWVYALCTLQTVQGYPGRGYNRVARMKGGYGNRPRVGLAPDLELGSRFIRDVAVLVDSYEALLDRGYSEAGAALVWLEPWDGTTSLSLKQLSPHFIEVCWRIRCAAAGSAVVARYTTTAARRCLPEVETGDVGDAWIPVDREGGALTVGPAGFEYRRLSSLVFEQEYAPAPAQRVRADDGGAIFLLAAAMARGQGKTAGLHERVLQFSGGARLRLGNDAARTALGLRAAARVERVATMRSKVLYPALKALAGNGETYSDCLDRRVDEMFFDHLLATTEMEDEEARLAFERALRGLARAELETAIRYSGLPAAGRYKAVSAAERMFEFGLRKHFPDASSGSHPTNQGDVR